MNKFSRISEAQFHEDKIGLYCAYDEIKLPSRATKGSVGYDIYSLNDFTLSPGETIVLPTGLKVILDEDKWLMITPRSGLGFKYRTQLWNTVGVIDSDYQYSLNDGHMWVKMVNESDKILEVKKGQAYCQGILMQRYLMDGEDVPTKERIGGFGSTTK